ncbi:MAG TPA: hypothetical protein VHM24_10195, partial [Gemmatimonadaceae bacterium]|nr:hypothetical protein [Gemmatimonadaceae bacterium]
MKLSRVTAMVSRIGIGASLVVGCTTGLRPGPAGTVGAITPADVRTRIYAVADDSMGGREAGSPGNFKMTSYLAHEAARLGLEPGGENGTFFQTIPMIRRSADSASTFSVNGESLTLFS